MGTRSPDTITTTATIVDGWLAGVRSIPSPNCGPRPEPRIDLLVIHSISLPPGQFGGRYIDDFFLNCLDSTQHPYFESICSMEVSAHLLINRSGVITQYVSFDDRAWHAGASHYWGRDNCNDFSIGIELEGCDEQPYTDRQYQVLARCSRQLIQHYPGITAEHVVGHSDIAPGRKTDPGPLFDWPRFRDSLCEGEY